MSDGTEKEICYFLFVILNGKFDVQSLNFAKSVKGEHEGGIKYSAVVNRKNKMQEAEEKRSLSKTLKLMYDSDEEQNNEEKD